ncbi:MAG: hypothetical protein ACYS0G_11745 [Planctomycetota bacterium]|jgi:hypothetical protein
MDRRSPGKRDASKRPGGKGRAKRRRGPKRTPEAQRRAKALEHITKASHHLEEADYLDQIKPASQADDPGTAPEGSLQETSVGSLSKPARDLLLWVARNGVKQVTTRPRGAGRGDLQLDASLIENLTPRLFRLAEILAEETASEDEFNGFRTYEGVAKRLTEHFGCCFTEHAISQLVLRLKQALWERNVNSFYIERGQQRVRFRWRRQGADAAA